jgi:menaquinone-specific isochorismate synthase
MTRSASVSVPNPSSVRERLFEAVRSARARTAAKLVVAELEAPARPAETLLDLEPATDASYFAEPSGYEHVGLGVARLLTAQGATRFRAIGSASDAVFSDLGEAASRLRLFGGFAFQPGGVDSSEWRAFGEARFVLPRVAYEREGDKARLLLVLDSTEHDSAAALTRTIELAERALGLLDAAPAADPDPALLELVERPDSEFIALVDQVRAAISSGEFEKIVLARRVELGLGRPVLASRVERRLADIAPECVRFGFRAGGATFLGATPERLVVKNGRAFETEAVAGSLPVGDLPPGRLLESSKNRAEQAIVVRELLRALEPLTKSIDHAETPEIHRLRHVAHLRTRIRGTLLEPIHVLDLVERLHPTPAVGGVPSAKALGWISAHEPDERGWYAGPIGWVDNQGDGSFVVALRSGILHGNRATLYAGAGIVEGSDASTELAETRWKLQALLGAFGVAP